MTSTHPRDQFALLALATALFVAPAAAQKNARPLAVLVHGYGAGPGEWDELAKALRKRGFDTEAVTLMVYTPEEVLAAVEKRGPRKRVVCVGGSVGADLCASVSARIPGSKAALLSPVNRVPAFDPRRALVAAAPDDPRAFAVMKSLRAPASFEAKSGHGAQMLKDPAFLRALLSWLEAP